MSFEAMPFLFLNMGGEMAYILEQRLQAQNVGNEKSTKVLCDIVTVMLSKSFLEELFEPQEMYTRQGLRQFFEQIAHSSVMRLNEASMDKLFDLMIMAVKYQFLLCKEPSELVLVTMNHLDGMKAIFKGHPNIVEHIDYASTLAIRMRVDTEHARFQLMDHFGDTPLWQMAVIRSELLNFLLGARVKVSLMLRERRQLDDGRFVLFPQDEQIELPYNAVVPGSIRYVENGALVRSDQFPVEEHFKVSPDFYQDRTMIRGTTLGQNMYKMGADQTRDALLAVQQLQSGGAEGAASAAGGNELGLLDMLIKGETLLGADGFEMQLFDDDETGADRDEEADGKKKKAGTTKKAPVAKRSSLTKAMKEMSLEKSDVPPAAEKPPSRKGTRKGKELLDMMDQESAAAKSVGPPKKQDLARKRSGSAKRGQ